MGNCTEIDAEHIRYVGPTEVSFSYSLPWSDWR